MKLRPSPVLLFLAMSVPLFAQTINTKENPVSTPAYSAYGSGPGPNCTIVDHPAQVNSFDNAPVLIYDYSTKTQAWAG